MIVRVISLRAEGLARIPSQSRVERCITSDQDDILYHVTGSKIPDVE